MTSHHYNEIMFFEDLLYVICTMIHRDFMYKKIDNLIVEPFILIEMMV